MIAGNGLETDELFTRLRRAAKSSDRVSGLTHCHYKYPARFSPKFVAAAIDSLTLPGDTVLDPYMGGGTTIVEALGANRRAIGCDINSLAVFVTQVKTAQLSNRDYAAVLHWALDLIPGLSYRTFATGMDEIVCDIRTKNLDLPQARAIKKFLALALLSLDEMPSLASENFARCVLLNSAQWALNGRKHAVGLREFRERVATTAIQMLEAAKEFKQILSQSALSNRKPILIHDSTENIASAPCWQDGQRADIVITSPPYPGVHVLYHRWQVDGRKETPAPYWIANKLDGQGVAYYNFGDRQREDQDDYFDESLKTLKGIRAVMKDGAPIIQVLAFSEPRHHLPRYLENMALAGFNEVTPNGKRYKRIWRNVPGRSWHAHSKGRTNSAREIVLLHEAA